MDFKKICMILSFLFIPGFFLAQAGDSVTITTYYPSPYGVYRTMRIYPTTEFTADTDCSKPGEVVFSGTPNNESLLLCKWDTPVGENRWKVIAAASSTGYWSRGEFSDTSGNKANFVYNLTAEDRVAIIDADAGDVFPGLVPKGYRFYVSGKVGIGKGGIVLEGQQSPNVFTTAPQEGMLYYHAYESDTYAATFPSDSEAQIKTNGFRYYDGSSWQWLSGGRRLYYRTCPTQTGYLQNAAGQSLSYGDGTCPDAELACYGSDPSVTPAGQKDCYTTAVETGSYESGTTIYVSGVEEGEYSGALVGIGAVSASPAQGGTTFTMNQEISGTVQYGLCRKVCERAN